MRVFRATSLSFAVLAACARLSHGEPVQRDAVLLSHSASALPAPPATPAAPERPWIEPMRMERWADALALIEAENETVQKDPLVRLAWGVAAQRANSSERSLVALNELDGALPSLSDRVLRVRAEASFATGDYRNAEVYYRARSDSAGRLRAAEVLAKLGERDAARVAVDTLLKKLPARGTLCSIEAPARQLRASLLPENATAALAAEYRWLSLEAPLCATSAGADTLLEAMPASYRLKPNDRLARARVFADAGRVDDVERELELCGTGSAQPAGTREHLRGLARLRARRELPQAAELLCTAAAQSAATAAERKFLAARAHERNGDDNAAHALYQQVSRGFAGSSFAEHADYRDAQLAYAAGKFEAAVVGYERYIKRYGARGRYIQDARDERAVALLALGRVSASKELRALADATNDERARLRYTELEGVALLNENKQDQAKARFSEVVQKAPLSFYAMVASARLQSLGVAPPSGASSTRAATGKPIEPRLPASAELLHRVGLDREAESALGEAEGSVQRDYTGRGEEALCRLYGLLAPAERRFRWGQRSASAEELGALPSNDRRWLWDCNYPRPYGSLVTATAEENGIDPAFIYAVMRQESAFRPEAASGAQAQGLLQLIPSTAARLASELSLPATPDMRVPPENVRLGAYYLRKLQAWFGGSLVLTAAGYNAGPQAVVRWLRGAPKLPLDVFVARIPYDETRTYVERVLSNYARYRYLAADSANTELALTLPEARVEGADLY